MPALSVARVPFLLDEALQNAVDEHLPGTPVAFQGVDFAPSDPALSGKLWVRPVCRCGDVLEEEKGQDGWSRRVGVYLLDLFAPRTLDPVDVWQAAAVLESAFRRRCFDGLQCEDPKTENLGLDGNGNLQLRVSVPWWCWSAA